MVVFYKVLLCIISTLVIVSCRDSNIKIGDIYDSMLVDKVNINCPDGRFISNLDQLEVLNDDNNLQYKVIFNKVNWECYIEENNNSTFYSIDFKIDFKISYQDEKKINKDIQNFEYLIAILDKNKEVIERKIYTFNFENEGGFLSFTKKSEDNVKLIIPKNLVKKFGELKILLGFIILN